ncbi:helix-turn-helix domain-containing protein [Paenibacillus sp. GD4]|uniref:helix-turn-helix domain-containing protein n=1 Tax=Paenibacillus sp. GD4 TaxID=3068890 RepID=UPI002796BB3B|nr:helix-turn-helix domain-containing protein [Paenibacillus sp. GD4]MDQ1909651.1 helix-turn-helix domain-containing protein [Paenibacillus sp. GD4]
MQNNWYKRLLLSYFPVFFVAISTILFISFLVVTEVSKKEAEKASRISSAYVVDTVESTLRGIEQTVLKEMVTNPNVGEFFDPKPNTDQALVRYRLSEVAKGLMTNQYLLHSVYFYRFSDRLVLTHGSAEPLEFFYDKNFIEQEVAASPRLKWSSPRKFREFISEPEENVITMSKRALLPFGNQGLVVINVRTNELLRVVDEMVDSQLTFMEIHNREELLYPLAGNHSAEKNRKVLSEIPSDYLGWTFTSGLQVGQLFGWVSVISYLWVTIGVIVLLLCIVYLVYITRRNYKPIEIILQRIQAYQQRYVLQGKPPVDEFSFIEKALESLIDQTNVYEKRFQEDLMIHRKQFYQELLSGEREITWSEWKARMERLNLDYEFSRLAMTVSRIDRYSAFQQEYTERDQHLLKFVLTNVIHEFAKQGEVSVWTEWVTNDRLAALFLIRQEEGFDEEQLKRILESFRQWVQENLKFSVTVGIGSVGRELSALHPSYLEAMYPLRHRLTLGSNHVSIGSEVQRSQAQGAYEYYQRVTSAVQYYRMTNPAWSDVLREIFKHMTEDRLNDEEIRSLLDYMVHLFRRELEEMPEELGRGWDRMAPDLVRSLAEAESVEQLGTVFIAALDELFQHYVALRDAKSQTGLLEAMKKYIEEHFTDPNLSLNQLSDRFEISPKYASQLFKEQFGLKFVDFLVQLRMEKAKQLLLETNEPIQDIAEKVGYTHGISFGRTFKKIVGATPGDYRKLM